MANRYSLKTFLRQTSNHMLERYFEKNNIELDFDFGIAKPRAIEPLFEEIIAHEKHNAANDDFMRIHALRQDKATKIIVEEAEHEGIDILNYFDNMKSGYDKALFTFMHYKDLFETAKSFVHIANLPKRSFRKERNVPTHTGDNF